MVVTGGRRIRVRLGEGPERRYHIQGRQKGQENTQSTREVVTINNNTGLHESGNWNEPRCRAPAGGGAANMAFVLGSCLKPDREISKISGSQMEGRWPRSQQRRVGCHAA
ncbi:hypothetical protein HPP92_007085 [Vanilla planifolia]|uniref:Uncharacterized protein n=1 Tax=Vanilla planifolia TaxID=51239 RepID=A0A835V5J9_VANPL|nr:hypothetical protein HPP92_007085 [Vanilla planifolia]